MPQAYLRLMLHPPPDIDTNTQFAQDDFRNVVPRFTEENRKANGKLVKVLGQIADGKGATRAQVALAWLLAQKPWIVPIPGPTQLHRLQENIDAADLLLTPADLAAIATALKQIKVVGDRYPAYLQKNVNR